MRPRIIACKKSHLFREGAGQNAFLLALSWAICGFLVCLYFWKGHDSRVQTLGKPAQLNRQARIHKSEPWRDQLLTDRSEPWRDQLPADRTVTTSYHQESLPGPFWNDDSLPKLVAPVTYNWNQSAQPPDVFRFENALAEGTLPNPRNEIAPIPNAGNQSLAEVSPIFPADLPEVQQLGFVNNEPVSRIESDAQNNLVTVSVRGAALHSVLSLIAEQQGLSIAAPSNLDTPITLSLQPTTLNNALDAITAISGCTWTRVQDIIYVTPVNQTASATGAGVGATAATHANFVIQGRELRVFNLGYASATDIEKTITGLLSPIGKVFVRVTDSKDKRKSSEQIVVEDMPGYVARIADFISQVDVPPRQVMVEARILQVKLENDNRHGVNFETLGRIAGADLTFKSQALATGTGTAGVVTVDGTDFNALLDCLVTNNNSKTLATPKLMMINGQESKLQIGRRLGYFVTTTTQTSTLQDVQFLEVGVVLTVTPQITDDGHIVLKVRPKVSNGDINPNTTLPEEETTEVDTSVMVADGRGIIIGGLIQEIDNERQTKLPFLGDLWLVGRAFQRRVVERERNEVIVALLPRIVPPDGCLSPEEEQEFQRVDMPLLTPTLETAQRPEPSLNDAIRNPIPRNRFQFWR